MNRVILKNFKICHFNKINYRTELQKFTLMYNTIPQGTIEKFPSEFLLTRNNRNKIPSLIVLVGETANEEEQDMDTINKHKANEKEDTARN